MAHYYRVVCGGKTRTVVSRQNSYDALEDSIRHSFHIDIDEPITLQSLERGGTHRTDIVGRGSIPDTAAIYVNRRNSTQTTPAEQCRKNLSRVPSDVPDKPKRQDVGHSEELRRVDSIAETIDAANEITILLMGDSGVGKTTWINAFVNYLTYANLDEAVQGELKIVIPITLDVDDLITNKSERIMAGCSNNENYEVAGMSVTQYPQTYTIACGRRTVRVIDTPGVNDTAGDMQDEKNINRIICHISQYQHINAICVLLKSQTHRMTPTFAKSMRQLLSTLHTSSSKNIIFGITHSRATYFKPGSTLKILQAFAKDVKLPMTISEKAVFCFDSEPVTYLIKSKLAKTCRTTAEERKAAADSWQKNT